MKAKWTAHALPPIEKDEFLEALAGLKTGRVLGLGFWAPREVEQLSTQRQDDLLHLRRGTELIISWAARGHPVKAFFCADARATDQTGKFMFSLPPTLPL